MFWNEIFWNGVFSFNFIFTHTLEGWQGLGWILSRSCLLLAVWGWYKRTVIDILNLNFTVTPCHSPFKLRLYLYIYDEALDLSLGLTPACVWEWDIFIWNGLQMRVSLRPEGANETLILTINWGHYHPQPLSWICILEFIYIKRALKFRHQ